MVKVKGISPAEARRRTTLDILGVLASRERATISWVNLWKTVKREKKASYPGFKETVTRLVDVGVVRAQLNPQEISNPDLTLVTPFTRMLSLMGILEVLEKRMFGPVPDEIATEALFSSADFKDLSDQMTAEDRSQLVDSIVKTRILLFKIGERAALKRLREDDRVLVDKVLGEVDLAAEKIRKIAEAEPLDPQTLQWSDTILRDDYAIGIKTYLFYYDAREVLTDLRSDISVEESPTAKAGLKAMLEFVKGLDQKTVEACRRLGKSMSEVAPFLLIRPVVPISAIEDEYMEFFEKYHPVGLSGSRTQPNLSSEGHHAF